MRGIVAKRTRRIINQFYGNEPEREYKTIDHHTKFYDCLTGLRIFDLKKVTAQDIEFKPISVILSKDCRRFKYQKVKKLHYLFHGRKTYVRRGG